MFHLPCQDKLPVNQVGSRAGAQAKIANVNPVVVRVRVYHWFGRGSADGGTIWLAWGGLDARHLDLIRPRNGDYARRLSE
jgi:hypothetical protein